LKRGTKIIISLKQDAWEFCEVDKVKGLIKKYSEFINFPIYIWSSKDVTKEVPQEEEFSDDDHAHKHDDDDEDLDVHDEPSDSAPAPKTKTVRETVWDWELVNDNKAIWLRSKDEIEDEDYRKFYKSMTKDYDDPLTWIHFSAEGEVEFKSILFIPKHAPHDLFENY